MYKALVTFPNFDRLRSLFLEPLKEVSGQQFLNQWIRPHFWFVMYADDHTCNKTTPPPYHEAVEYEMTFLNPDSQGSTTDHFGDDLRGMFLCSSQVKCNSLFQFCMSRATDILHPAYPALPGWGRAVRSQGVAHHQQGRTHA